MVFAFHGLLVRLIHQSPNPAVVASNKRMKMLIPITFFFDMDYPFAWLGIKEMWQVLFLHAIVFICLEWLVVSCQIIRKLRTFRMQMRWLRSLVVLCELKKSVHLQSSVLYFKNLCERFVPSALTLSR